MGLAIEAIDRTAVDKKITENFLSLHNLQVTKHFENAPILVWTVESTGYPPPPLPKGAESPIILTRQIDKERDTVSIRVNRSFESEFTRRQRILAVYYLGQLSLEHGSLNSVTFDASLSLQSEHTIIEVLDYSREGNFPQLINDLADENSWLYTRFPQG